MNNPYQSSKVRGLKRQSGVLYRLVCVLLYPKYLLWRVAESMPGVQLRLEEVFRFLTTPLRAIGGFLNAWAGGRSWGKLWVASPILVMALLGFTIFYINVNKNRGRAFASYYQGALKAMNEGDFRQSDSLFAKLIHHPSYKDNDQVLFRAMVSAAQNGNTPRVLALRKVLIEERGYDPAKRWVVDNFIARNSEDKEEGLVYAEMALGMVESAQDPEAVSYWRQALARIRVKLQNFEGAIEVLEGDANLSPSGYLLLAQVYVLAGDDTEYLKVLRRMLDYIEKEDPNEQLYFSEKVEGWAMIAANARSSAEALELLPRALELVARKRALAAGDRQTYSTWLSELNIRMFQFALKNRNAESRREGFRYFDEALKYGEVPARAGSTILSVVNSTASYSLLSGQIVDVAVNEGGCGAHLALGLEAWIQNDEKAATLHFKIANAVQGNALEVLRATARDLALRSVGAQLDLAVFRGVNRSNYQRAQDMLDLIVNVDPAVKLDVSFDRCYIYSLREDWQRILSELEPQIASMQGEDLVMAYAWIEGSYRGLAQPDRAEEYNRMKLAEMRKQKNAR